VSFLILTFSSDFDFSSWTFTSGFFSTIGSLLFFDLELARIDISLMMERPRPDFLLSSSSASGVESTFFVDFFRSFGELSLPLNDPNLALASSLMLTFSSDFDVTSSTFSSGFFSVYESLLFLDWERARIDIALMMERPRPDFFSSSISGSFSTLLSPSSAVESLLFFDLERARIDISLMMERPRPDSFFSSSSPLGVESTFFDDFLRSFGELILPLNEPNLALASSLMLTFSSVFDFSSSTFSSSLGVFSTPSSAVVSLLFFDLVRARIDISLMMERPRLDFFSSSDFFSTSFTSSGFFLRVADLDRLRPLELERFFFSTVTSPAFSIIFCEKDGAFVRFPERLRLRPLFDFERPERLDLEADLDRLRLLDEWLFEDLASFSTLAAGSTVQAAASSSTAASLAGSSRDSSASRDSSSGASVETDSMLCSRSSRASASGGDDSSPASACCSAGAAVTALTESTVMVGDSPMAAAGAGGAAVSMVSFGF